MLNSPENRRLNFFAMTQSEFFLVVIFIILSYSIFQLSNFNKIQAEGKQLRDSTEIMKVKIDTLTASVRHWEEMLVLSKKELDSLKQFTNTGIGNCLGESNGFLAELSIAGDDLLKLQFLSNYHSETINFIKGTIKYYTKFQFAHFGEQILDFSKSQPTECRFSIRIKDSEQVTKQQLKTVYLLCNRYFNALITK